MAKRIAQAPPLLQPLFNQLVDDLQDVYDAHYVCATLAAACAAHGAVTALVGLSDPAQKHYDVWVASPEGDLSQYRWPHERASFEKFVESPVAIHLEKINQPVSEMVKSELWLLPKEDVLGVALNQTGEDERLSPPGVLCLIDPPSGSVIDASSLEKLSRIVGVYLDRAHLRLRIDQQAVEFAVVSEISHTLSSTLDMEDVFKQLTGTIRRTLHVEALSVGLSEPYTGDIVFVEELMGAKFENLPEIRVKLGQGIAGWVAQHSEPVIINNVYADNRFYAGADRRSGFRTNSMICIPLLVEQRTIGVLQAINRQYGEFTEHDLQLLKAIGGPLAAAIENARLHSDVLAEKRRVDTIFSSMSEGLLTVTRDGIITHANEALGALLLTESNELINKEVTHIKLADEEKLSDLLGDLLAEEEGHLQVTAGLQRKDRTEVPVLISGAATYDEKGGISELVLTFSDLTQVREVERMREDLFQAIAHELRTPLATILMYARLLREGKARDEEKAGRFLGVIERESDRLQRMVRRMLQLAKQEFSELHRSAEPVHFNPLFDALLDPLADQALEKGLMFRKRIEPDLPPVLGDAEQFEEIFGNLVTNAIKFTPAGSVTVSAKSENGRVVVQVRDEGIGIPPEALPHLFQRFYRAQTAVERGIAGTGLGLYMVKRNVEHYNGTITVESNQGEGTTFTVSFPVYEI